MDLAAPPSLMHLMSSSSKPALQVPQIKDQGEPGGQSKRKTPPPTEAATSQTRPKGRQDEFAPEPDEV